MLGILEEFKALGVQVIPQGNNIVIRPASIVPQDLKERLRAHKAEVLAMLKGQDTPIITAECRHCDGVGECSCPACNLRRMDRAVPCLMCRPLERRAWLAATRPEGCWHCSGSGECGCISCADGTCGVCGGNGKPEEPVQ